MFQYGPKLPPTPTAPFLRQTPGHSATVPLAVADVQDTSHPANERNADYVNFVKNFGHDADFSKIASPRNPNNENFGAFSGGPVYNVYLY